MDISIAQESTIKELFSNFLKRDGKVSFFSIPLYQREYSWREKQWKEMFDDLSHSFRKDGMDTDYWGNIIIYKNDINEYELVDGQQRLVTILLLMASLEKIEKNDKYLPLKFKDDRNNIWLKVAENSKLTQDENRHPFSKAKQYFSELISKENINRKDLLNHLLNTKISVVIVNDELESNLLFGRLNTRGILLSDVDLIKHKLFYDTERIQPPIGEDEVLKKWGELLKVMYSLNVSIEDFLPIWWEIHYNMSGKKLYASFKDELESSEYLKFLENILTVAIRIKELRENNSGNDNKVGRNLKWLLKISNSTQIWYVIIALQETTFNNKYKVALFELLTVFEFVRAIFPVKDFSELDKAYLKFGQALLSEVDGKRMIEREVITEIEKLKIKMKEFLPDIDDFSNSFTKLRYDDSGSWEGSSHEKMLARYAIYTLNNWLDVTNQGAGPKYRTKDDDDYSIEHIRAKSNANAGEFSPEYLIGNLVVFERPLNTDSGDKHVNHKMSLYKKSSYPQMKEFLFKNKRKYNAKKRKENNMEWEINNFDKNSIESRGRYLARCFYDRIDELLK